MYVTKLVPLNYSYYLYISYLCDIYTFSLSLLCTLFTQINGIFMFARDLCINFYINIVDTYT